MNCLRYPSTPCRFRCTDFCRLSGIGYPKDRGGPLFLPTDLAGLAGWFRYGVGITAASDLVSEWADQSGNGRHLVQATDTNKPSIQADGSILFDGNDNQLEVAYTADQPRTRYILFKQITWTSGEFILDGSTGIFSVFQRTISPQIGISAGTGIGNVSLALDSYGVIATVFNGASSLIQLNNGAPVTGDAGAGNSGGLSVGASRTIGVAAHIQVKEIIDYSTAHDAGQRAKVIEYLARVGNLTI